jgi:hypothetical protein
MTIEDAYKMQIDKDVIKTEMINKDSYLIDLKKCLYNHTIKINPPESWNGKIFLLDDTINEETMVNETIDEFYGIKGHVFYLNHIE